MVEKLAVVVQIQDADGFDALGSLPMYVLVES